ASRIPGPCGSTASPAASSPASRCRPSPWASACGSTAPASATTSAWATALNCSPARRCASSATTMPAAANSSPEEDWPQRTQRAQSRVSLFGSEGSLLCVLCVLSGQSADLHAHAEALARRQHRRAEALPLRELLVELAHRLGPRAAAVDDVAEREGVVAEDDPADLEVVRGPREVRGVGLLVGVDE